MPTLLIVEDEKAIRDMFRFALLKTDFLLLEAENGKELWKILDGDKNLPDVILMDWMLPDSSGIELTKYIKTNPLLCDIPIIMLTARSEEKDKIEGLDAGADDYMVKPFSPLELLARIRAVLRRSHKQVENNEDSLLRFENLIMDMASHKVSVEENAVSLSSKEYKLLKIFMKKPNRVYSRSQLMDRIWGRNSYVEERTVDVQIRRLRKALSPWKYDKLIHSVRGSGYRFSRDDH